MQPTSTTPVARDDSPEPRLLAIINRHAILILVGLSALAVVFYAALSIAPYATYRSNAFDLGIFNQAIYHYAHLQPATSTIRGVNNLLGDHFELLLPLVSPLYWIFGNLTALLVQIGAVIFGAVGVFKLVSRETDKPWAGLVGAATLLLSYGVCNALGSDFHTNVLGAMLIPWVFLAFRAERLIWFYVALAGLLASKENLALVAVFICLSLCIFGPRKYWRQAAAGAVISLAYFTIVLGVVIPALNHGEYDHWEYRALGATPLAAIGFMLIHPLATLQLLFDQPDKLETWKYLLLSGGILAIWQPRYAVVLIPILAQKFFTSNPGIWGIGAHYSVEIAPLIAIGAAVTVGRLRRPPLATAAAVLLIGANLAILVSLGAGRAVQASWYRPIGFDRASVTAVLKQIPPGASVSAQGVLVPHLANRQSIYLFPEILDSQYVVLNLRTENVWPAYDLAAFQQLRQQMVDSGRYRVVTEQNGMVLYKRTGQPLPTPLFCSAPDKLLSPGWLRRQQCPND